MVNDYGSYANVAGKKYVTSDGSDNWESIVPISASRDKELQNAISGNVESFNDRALDLDSGVWGGMESGVVMHDSTQSQDWISTIPSKYRKVAEKWEEQI